MMMTRNLSTRLIFALSWAILGSTTLIGWGEQISQPVAQSTGEAHGKSYVYLMPGVQLFPHLESTTLVSTSVTTLPSRANSMPLDEAQNRFEVTRIEETNRGTGAKGVFVEAAPGHLDALDVSVRDLIGFAYGIRQSQISGGPTWTDSETLDISGIMTREASQQLAQVTPDEQIGRYQRMLRDLLMDKFQLRLTSTSVRVPVFRLVVSSSRPQPHDVHALDARQLGPNEKQVLGPNQSPNRFPIFDMQALAERLSGDKEIGCEVLDETGLTGNYEIQVDRDTFTSLHGASLLAAIRDQLGLDLVPAEGETKAIVIESISKPLTGETKLFKQSIPAFQLAAFRQTSSPIKADVATSSKNGEDYVPTMSFDVSSIHESNDNPPFSMSIVNPPHSSLFIASHQTAKDLIQLAYNITYDFGLKGGPEWVSSFSDRFMIQAKSSEVADKNLENLSDNNARLEKRHMLQTLLADRFKLQTHWDTIPGRAYDLVVVKRGLIQETSNTGPSADKGVGNPIRNVRDGHHGTKLIAQGSSVSELIFLLGYQLGSKVSDKTGLSGLYDFTLDFHGINPGDNNDDPNTAAPLTLAIQDQLGLKLIPIRGSAPVLVIDHIEKPSAN
jgi:uncharacterized protein (TIGR03435 family)